MTVVLVLFVGSLILNAFALVGCIRLERRIRRIESVADFNIQIIERAREQLHWRIVALEEKN